MEYTEPQVATDALTVVVNKDLDGVDCLTTDQLNKLWAPGSKVNNWKQLDPSFPDQKISLFGPGTDSGTFDYLAADVIGDESEKTRDDYEASEDDNVLVQVSQGTQGATGYFGYTYYEENTDKLKALAIDDGKGCVEPSAETAQAGEYTPLSRPLFIYVATRRTATTRRSRSTPTSTSRTSRRSRPRPSSSRSTRRTTARPSPPSRASADHQPDAANLTDAPAPARPALRGGPGPCVPRPRRRPRPGETAVKAVLLGSALLSVLITLGIIVALIEPVVHFFRQVSFAEVLATEGKYAVLPLVAGTLMTTLIALLVAVPLGLGAAMYLSEYASKRARKTLKPTLELLAGVPSSSTASSRWPSSRRRCCRTSSGWMSTSPTPSPPGSCSA